MLFIQPQLSLDCLDIRCVILQQPRDFPASVQDCRVVFVPDQPPDLLKRLGRVFLGEEVIYLSGPHGAAVATIADGIRHITPKWLQTAGSSFESKGIYPVPKYSTSRCGAACGATCGAGMRRGANGFCDRAGRWMVWSLCQLAGHLNMGKPYFTQRQTMNNHGLLLAANGGKPI